MDTGLKRTAAAILLVAACAWSMPAAAFCFFMGGASRSHNNAGYYAPPVMPGIGSGWYPASAYAAPAPPALILPVIIQRQRLPAARGYYPQQHIFR